MNVFRSLLLIVIVSSAQSALAQPLHWMGQKKPYKWQFGLGWNAVDDDGRDFCQPFDTKQSWNAPPFPSRLLVDKYLRKGFSLEFAGAYNNYKQGKLINDSTNRSGLFISADLNAKLSFAPLLYPMKWLDPYVSMGLGMTHRDAYDQTVVGTLNVSLGVNFWIYRNWGIQLQSSAKFGINGNFYTTNSDYLQHTASIVYKLPDRRDRGSFQKKQHKWTKKRPKFKGARRAG